MKPDKDIFRILSVLDEGGWKTSQAQEKQLVDYVFLVREWNRKINLVSRTPHSNIVLEHLLPSVLYAVFLRNEIGDEIVPVVDLGSGGGFPGIVLSILLEKVEVTMVDASRKKTLFLKRVVRDLQLNADVLHSRVEQLGSFEKRFSFAVARGFSNLSELISYSKPLMSEKGVLFALKGDNYLQEMREIPPDGVTIHEMKIDDKWLELAPNLAHKRMIKVEF